MEFSEAIRFRDRAVDRRDIGRTLVVVPCFNEAERLPVEAFRRAVEAHSWLEFFLVDDGSTDRTQDVLQGLRVSSPSRIRVISLESNSGKAEAVRRGVLAACGSEAEFIGYWDADLSTPLDAIAAMRDVLRRLPDTEIVLGSRRPILGRQIVRRRTRWLLGRAFAAATAVALRLPIYDTQCGAKLFRRTPRLAAAFAEPFSSRWIFDVEWLVRWRSAAARNRTWRQAVYEFPLDQWHEVSGSRLRRRDFAVALGDLARIAWRYRLCPYELPAGSMSTPAAGASRRAA